ncbi:MAG TPA: tetratricopeptide repeat protein, partial [Mucilaginibacter sp.]
MKRAAAIFFLTFLFCSGLFAQVNDLQLARQYTTNGELQKALDIYQKLYKQDNDAYYSYYISGLLSLKKFDEAESVTKKMLRKHPGDYQFSIGLGRIYTQRGETDKANAVYDDLIKNLPPDAGEISNLATEFYQAENVDYAIKIFLQGRKLMKNDNLYSFELINLYRFKRDKPALVEEYLNFLPSNPTFITQAENALSSLFEGADDYGMLKAALFRHIQKDPQQTIYTDLLIWQFLQQKEFDQALNQALALSRRQDDDGNSIFDLCQTLITNEAYETAVRGYEYIISKGKEKQLYI